MVITQLLLRCVSKLDFSVNNATFASHLLQQDTANGSREIQMRGGGKKQHKVNVAKQFFLIKKWKYEVCLREMMLAGRPFLYFSLDHAGVGTINNLLLSLPHHRQVGAIELMEAGEECVLVRPLGDTDETEWPNYSLSTCGCILGRCTSGRDVGCSAPLSQDTHARTPEPPRRGGCQYESQLPEQSNKQWRVTFALFIWKAIWVWYFK